MEILLDKLLGRGLSAEVWKAIDGLGRTVAVKFVDPTMPYARDFALNHAKALARVECKSVVRILALDQRPHPDTEQECPVIIMDYIDGRSLAQVPADETFSEHQALQYGRDLIEGVAAMHAVGLVHGDLHEANLILRTDSAVLIDILYTHSLAQISASYQNRLRDSDCKDIIRLLRLILRHHCTTREADAFAEGVPDEALSLASILARYNAVFQRDTGSVDTETFPAPWRSLPTDLLPLSCRLDSAHWAPNGRRVALLGDNDALRGSVHVLNLDNWTDCFSFQVCSSEHTVRGVSWSADGSTVAASGWSHMCVWRADSRKEIVRRELFLTYGQCEVSPDGNQVAWASVFGAACLLSISNGREHRAQFHDGAATCGTALVWAPSGAKLVVAVEMNAAHIWDDAGRFVCSASPILPDFESTGTILWTPDSTYVASLNAHTVLSLINAEHGWRHGSDVSRLLPSDDARHVPRSLAVTGSLVVAAAGDVVQVWDPSQMTLVRSWRLTSPLRAWEADGCSLSPGGNLLAAVTASGTCLHDVRGGDIVHKIDSNRDRFRSVGWDTKARFWCYSRQGTIHLISADTTTAVQCRDEIVEMSMSPSGVSAAIITATDTYLWFFLARRLCRVSLLVDSHHHGSLCVREVPETTLLEARHEEGTG